MAFPVVQATAISGSSPNQTPHSVTLPSGVVAGDLLFVFHSSFEVGTFPAGWVVFHVATEPIAPHIATFAYRKATGGETSVSVSVPSSTSWAAQAFRISGAADPTVTPPEAASVSGRVGVNPNADPPALSPAGGSQQYLWFATYTSSSSSSQGAPPTTPGFGNSLISGNASQDTESVRSNTETATLNPSPAWTSPDNSHTAATVSIPPFVPPPPGTAALTGTVTNDDEAQIRAGGSNIVLTLTDDTWVAAGGTFDAQRQNIINGIDSAQAEAGGWDAQVRPAIPVGNVVRTSNTVVTITLPAVPTYEILANESVTATIPGSAVALGAPIVAAPAFTITNLAPGTAALAGTVTDDLEADIRAGGSDITLTLSGTSWVEAGGVFDAQRQNIIDGLVSAQSEPDGWNAAVSPAIQVTDVVRTSDTVVTITLPGVPTYSITADEVIEATIPETAVTDPAAIVATPTFTVTNIAEAPSGIALPFFSFG